MVLGVAFLVSDYFALGFIPALAVQIDLKAELSREVFVAFIAALIWIPYFHYSRRVRNTFVKVLPDDLGGI